MPALSASWLADRLLIHFSDGLAEAIGATDIDIEGAILDGDLIDVVGLTAAQRSALESISIRDVLMATIPDQVAFEEERFEAWCADAFEFVNKNSRHEEFEQIFSSELNYSVILLDMLIFDSSTKEFKRILSDMTGTEFASEVKNDYPVNFLQIVPELCAISIPEALKSLSYDVTAETRKRSLSSRKYLSALRKVRRDPSFADRRGLVSFRRTGNKLEIGGDTVGPRSVDYRRQLDRAIGRVRGSLIMSRIHNRDPDLAALFEEYNDELMAETPSASAISLWVIGQDIDNRVRVSQKKNSEDEGLDDNTIYYLMTFLTAHNLYLQSFPEIERLSEDLGRSTMLYQSLDAAARNAPWTLLNDLSKESGIFEIKTKNALGKAAEANERPDSEKSKGLVALGLALVRGALRAMGATTLESVLGSLDDESAEAAVESLNGILSDPSLEGSIARFFRTHRAKLLELAYELPVFFHWIRVLLSMIGLQ